ASIGALANPYDWYLDAPGNKLYVYAAGNPATYYTAVAPITMTATRLLYVSSKSNLEFQHLALRMFPNYGVKVDGTADYVTFANMYVESTVPNAVLPHGFYVHPTTNPVHLCFWNVEVRRTDFGWGKDNDRNLVGRFTSRHFTVARLARVQDFYLRQY